MKNIQIRTFFILFGLMVLFSCSKEDPVDCSNSWATDLQNELTALSTAISVYSMDQSDANCNDLKQAYQDYINALKPYGNCATLTGVNRTEWQNAVNEAEAEIETIC